MSVTPKLPPISRPRAVSAGGFQFGMISVCSSFDSRLFGRLRLAVLRAEKRAKRGGAGVTHEPIKLSKATRRRTEALTAVGIFALSSKILLNINWPVAGACNSGAHQSLAEHSIIFPFLAAVMEVDETFHSLSDFG